MHGSVPKGRRIPTTDSSSTLLFTHAGVDSYLVPATAEDTYQYAGRYRYTSTLPISLHVQPYRQPVSSTKQSWQSSLVSHFQLSIHFAPHESFLHQHSLFYGPCHAPGPLSVVPASTRCLPAAAWPAELQCKYKYLHPCPLARWLLGSCLLQSARRILAHTCACGSIKSNQLNQKMPMPFRCQSVSPGCAFAQISSFKGAPPRPRKRPTASCHQRCKDAPPQAPPKHTDILILFPRFLETLPLSEVQPESRGV